MRDDNRWINGNTNRWRTLMLLELGFDLRYVGAILILTHRCLLSTCQGVGMCHMLWVYWLSFTAARQVPLLPSWRWTWNPKVWPRGACLPEAAAPHHCAILTKVEAWNLEAEERLWFWKRIWNSRGEELAESRLLRVLGRKESQDLMTVSHGVWG